MVDTPVGTTQVGKNTGVAPGQPQRPDAEHELGKGAYPDQWGGGENPAPPPHTGFPQNVPPSPAHQDLPLRLDPVRPTRSGYPDHIKTAPPPVQRDDHPTHPYGTDKNYDDPADANLVDMAAAGEAGHEAAPQPFRKRDQFPDLTTESVNVRMKQDYYPADTGRFQNGDLPRARAGELVAVPPDEALALCNHGLAYREDEFADEMAAAQVERDAQVDDDRKQAQEEAKKRTGR
jgi:hypothetical protein